MKNCDNSFRTVYLFTADHGMTNWGSHGAGTDDEILTPFVAWGAGIQENGVKHLLNQVDFAPLQSALLANSIPVNSIGILPLKILNGSTKYNFQAVYANLQQVFIFYNKENRGLKTFKLKLVC